MQNKTFQSELHHKKKSNQNSLYFSGGQKACIGQRFAWTEMKITLAKILSQYKIMATSETKLDFVSGDILLLAYPEVKVKFQRRN